MHCYVHRDAHVQWDAQHVLSIPHSVSPSTPCLPALRLPLRAVHLLAQHSVHAYCRHAVQYACSALHAFHLLAQHDVLLLVCQQHVLQAYVRLPFYVGKKECTMAGLFMA